MRTAPDLAPQLREMMTETRRLPRAVMETLVLIALRQPVTRSEIEDIRCRSSLASAVAP